MRGKMLQYLLTLLHLWQWDSSFSPAVWKSIHFVLCNSCHAKHQMTASGENCFEKGTNTKEILIPTIWFWPPHPSLSFSLSLRVCVRVCVVALNIHLCLKTGFKTTFQGSWTGFRLTGIFTRSGLGLELDRHWIFEPEKWRLSQHCNTTITW